MKVNEEKVKPKKVKPRLLKEAYYLSDCHREAEPDTIEAYLSPDDKEIRLIEVDQTVWTSKEVFALHFDSNPKKGIHFPVAIALVSPDEMVWIKNGKLKIPDGWDPELIPLYPRES